MYTINRYLTTEDTEAHRVFIISSVLLCVLCGEIKQVIRTTEKDIRRYLPMP